MPGGHIALKPKRVGETCFGSLPFDFLSSLAAGETLTLATVTASVYQGTDPNPTAIISGAASILNTSQVQQLFTGGILGTLYKLACQVTTSLGQILVQTAILAIVPDQI